MTTQWKVVHEFKPTEYLQGRTTSLSITTGDYILRVMFSNSNIALNLENFVTLDDNTGMYFDSDQQPKVGEWTRIEVSMEEEEEDGKHFLSLSVGGKQALKEEVDDVMAFEPYGFKVYIGSMGFYQPGYIRGLAVYEKQ